MKNPEGETETRSLTSSIPVMEYIDMTPTWEGILPTWYELGWTDSLKAYYDPSRVPPNEMYYYIQGWKRCSKWRWANPKNKGHPSDTDFRIPR